jgi:hypothetical protein
MLPRTSLRAAKPAHNWKMATEGGGRHSPSTVVWEEEGVLRILVPAPPGPIEPKVIDSGPLGRSPKMIKIARHGE